MSTTFRPYAPDQSLLLIHLVGVEFSRETRNVVAFETAPA